MSNLLKRSISAIVFVALMLGGILSGPMGFSILLLLICIACTYEWMLIFRKQYSSSLKWILHLVLVLLVNSALCVAAFAETHFDSDFSSVFFLIPLLALIFLVTEIFSTDAEPMRLFGIGLGAVFLIGLSLYAALLLPYEAASGSNPQQDYLAWKFLCPLFLIWANDSFAYLSGSVFGKRPLAPKISPKKTIEGSLGGVIACLMLAFGFSFAFDFYSKPEWLFLGALVALTATCGDLIESMIKRSLHIKDSGNILPGHGGFLDRFDAMLFSMPFVLIFDLFSRLW